MLGATKGGRMARLTKRSVESIALPAKRPVYAWDEQLPGFGVKVTANDRRIYIVKYRVGGGRAGRQRWFTLGVHGVLTCEQARAHAAQILAAARRGEDPQGNRRLMGGELTVADLWRRYEAEHLPRKKTKSSEDDRQKARDYVLPKLGRLHINEVTRTDIQHLHQSLAARPYQANRVLALVSKMMSLAETWGIRALNSNPCQHVQKFKEEARRRYLNAAELTRLGTALRSGREKGTIGVYAASAIQLLLLTGARLNEMLSARWQWVDWDRRVINLPDSKTGAKPIYLSDAALGVLRTLNHRQDRGTSDYIIKGRHYGKPLINLTKPWHRVCAEADLSGVRLHDLRHTAASIGVGTGIALPIVGRLLGHSQPQTTQRYAHVDSDPALVAANRIGDVIAKHIFTSDDNSD
jgi:integrase